MKVYKLTVFVIDFDQLGGEGIKAELENTRFANDCIAPKVLAIEERDAGEWSDDHPLNKHATQEAEIQRLFG